MSPSQAVLRWHMQQPGVVAIPRSGNPDHIAANAAVFGFALDADEMAAISGLGDGSDRHVDPAFAPAFDPPVARAG